MKSLLRVGAVSVLLTAVAFTFSAKSEVSAQGIDTKITETTVHLFEDASEVKDGAAILTRMKTGVAMQLSTVDLRPQDAVTVWWVIFNEPAKCSNGECGEDDIFMLDANGDFILNDDGSPPINGGGLEAANISAMRADGHVIDSTGTARFRASLAAGDVSEAIFGAGLQKPMTAEIHLVVRTHGPAVPGKVDSMLYEIDGGCEGAFPNPPCGDVQFAVFKPPAN